MGIITVTKTTLPVIQPFRDLFLAERSFQFVCNKCHGAGWADVYLLTIDDTPVGYGSVWGKEKREDRDTIFEFYLLKPFRKRSLAIFDEFRTTCGAFYIEAQSNDPLLAGMLFEFTKNIFAEAILFEDEITTQLEIPDTRFGQNKEGEYQLEQNGEVVATGGFVWNYNLPYIDMYYEVKENRRRQGFGSLFTQHLKSEAYRLNRVPAARCNADNRASKATLIKAGMKVCGYRLVGEL